MRGRKNGGSTKARIHREGQEVRHGWKRTVIQISSKWDQPIKIPIPPTQANFLMSSEIYRNPLWREFKESVFRKRSRRCMECGAMAETVHHTIYRPKQLPWEALISECVPMCWPCHTRRHKEEDMLVEDVLLSAQIVPLNSLPNLRTKIRAFIAQGAVRNP